MQRLAENGLPRPLVPIFGVEDQAADLDALTRGGVGLGARVHEGRVRDPPGPPVRLAIEALDQEDLLGRQPLLVVPALGGRVAHRERLALARGVDEPDGHELVLADAVGVGDGERVALDGLDGPPHVDDLHAALEELGGLLGGEVVGHAGERGRVRLVDVDALDRAAQSGGGVGLRAVAAVLGLAADGVVEDEDLGRAGARGRCSC